MGNRVRYVLMLVFPIPSKSLKNEIVVAVGECMEHLLTSKLRPKALPIFHRPHEVPLKVTFSTKLEISLYSIFIWSWPVNRDDLNGNHNKTHA